MLFFFFFSSRRRHTRYIGDWSSDVCSSDLADIDRIEVISGPGATLWGANAVNGVINVITKDATDTPGLLLSGGGGTEQRSEERRVGKECRSRWSPNQYRKKNEIKQIKARVE